MNVKQLEQFEQSQNINNQNEQINVNPTENHQIFSNNKKEIRPGLNITKNNDEENEEEKNFIEEMNKNPINHVKNTNYNAKPRLRVNKSDAEKAERDELMKNLRLQKEKAYNAQLEHQEPNRKILMKNASLENPGKFEKSQDEAYKLNEELDTDPNFLLFLIQQTEKIRN